MANEPDVTEDLTEDEVEQAEREAVLRAYGNTPLAAKQVATDLPDYFANDLRLAIRNDVGAMYYDLRTIAQFVDKVQFVLELCMYAVLGALIGWAIGSLLV
jgi:hypothetical protein